MKIAFIPWVIMTAVSLLLCTGCDSPGSTSAQYVPSAAAIELQGTWTGTDTNTGQSPVPFTITITSTSMVWNYGEPRCGPTSWTMTTLRIPSYSAVEPSRLYREISEIRLAFRTHRHRHRPGLFRGRHADGR